MPARCPPGPPPWPDRIGIEDDEAARERNQSDQNHYFDMDDAVPWEHHAEDGLLELRSNQQYTVMSNTLWNIL